MNMVFYVLYAFIGIVATIDDVKDLKVKNRTIILLGILSILSKFDSFFSAEILAEAVFDLAVSFFIFLTFLFFSAITNSMGGGDIKFLLPYHFFLGHEKGILSIILSFILLMVYGRAKKLKRDEGKRVAIPFIPFLFSSSVIIIILENLMKGNR